MFKLYILGFVTSHELVKHKESAIVWEYILASERPRVKDLGQGYFTIEELVDQYNNQYRTQYVGVNDGWLRHDERGTCHIKTLDGMCGVMMAHKLSIHAYHVPHFYRILEYMARKGNYTYIMMSNIAGGERLAAWKEVGFKPILAFRNRRTTNNVELILKEVPYEAA